MSLAKGNEKYLFVAWVFGRKSAFKALAEQLLLDVRPAIAEDYAESGTECYLGSGKAFGELIPEGLISV